MNSPKIPGTKKTLAYRTAKARLHADVGLEGQDRLGRVAAESNTRVHKKAGQQPKSLTESFTDK